METMTISDAEIESLIQDTADIKILDGSKKTRKTKTNTKRSISNK